MASLPEGFEVRKKTALPDGFQVRGEQKAAQPKPTQPEEQDESLLEMFTGEKRMTPQMESLEEIGGAPELNQLSVPAFKAALGLMTTGDTQSLKGILGQTFGDDVSFTEDAKGNTVVNLPSGQYALNKPGVSFQDVVGTVFDALAFTPAGRAATIPRAAAAAGATEAGIGAVEQSLGGEQVQADDVALASILGGAGKSLEEVIGGAYRMAKGSRGAQADDLIEAGKEAGVPVMTSDIIEPSTFAGKVARSTGEKVPLAGTGATRATQQEARELAMSEFADKYGSASYGDIVSSLQEKSSGVRKAAGNVLGATGRKLDDVGDIPVDETRMAIDDALNELNKPNVRVDETAIAELQGLKELMDMPQTFSSLKENRTVFRDIVESFGKGERSQLPTRSKALLNKAAAGMGKDMDEFAKTNLSPKEFNSWKKANAVYANEAQKLKKTRIKNILDKGDVTPEVVSNVLFSNKPSEVKALYQSLTTKGKENARAALISRAFDNANRRAGGATPNAFASELNKIAKNTDIFFKGKDKKQLEGFKRLMEATRRAQDAAVETPTGQQMLGAGAGFAAFTDLGATLGLGGTAGGLARLYESPAVRDALLRLGSVPKGSDAYLKALFEAQAALSAGAQSARREASEE